MEIIDKGIYIDQCTGGILDGKKFGYGKLASFGASTCCIIAAHCPASQKIFLAHINNINYFNDCRDKINYFIRQTKDDQVNIHLLSGQGQWEGLEDNIRTQIPNSNIVTSKLGTKHVGKSAQFMIDTHGNFTENFELNQIYNLAGHNNPMIVISVMYHNLTRQEAQLSLIIDEYSLDKNQRIPEVTNEFNGDFLDYSQLPQEHVFWTLEKKDQMIVRRFMKEEHSDKIHMVASQIINSICNPEHGSLNILRANNRFNSLNEEDREEFKAEQIPKSKRWKKKVPKQTKLLTNLEEVKEIYPR